MTRMRAMWAGLALVVALPAWAGLEPSLGTCGGSSCLWQEPVVSAPSGWMLKDLASSRYHAKAFAPTGTNFENATAVMYAKAVSKQGQPATLAAFIGQDIASFRAQDAKLQVKTISYVDGDGHPLQAVQLVPGGGPHAQWETIAYGEEGGYYLVFALSANGVLEHDTAVPAFKAMLATYHAGPAPKH